jgi:N-acetylglucosaminyl-diphospho-decaprenol L-rhamnosyltransferase
VAADVAVVVANYAGEDVLDDCLRSVLRQTHAPAEVMVVDAGPSEHGRRIAQTNGATVLVRPNRGLGYLYNEGARAARSELVLLLNNDVALEPRCLELLVDEIAASPRRFAADPRQVSWDGSALIHGRATLRRGPLLRQPLPGFRLDLQGHAVTPVPTVSANGGAMLAHRERLLALGGFDETMFLDFEDIDLCWRAWSRGWSSVHVPEATVRHRVGTATRESGLLRRRVRDSHHNLVRFALKCFPAEDAARVVLGELLRLPRHPSLVAPALVRVALELPEILRARQAVRPSRSLSRWMLAGQPEAQLSQP